MALRAKWQYGPVCHPQNIIWTSASLRSIYYFVGDIPVHKLPYGSQYHELFVKYIFLRLYFPYLSLLASRSIQQYIYITSSSRFSIMTSNLFPVSPSPYFGRKLGLLQEAKNNIKNNSRHFGPNGPQYPELFVKY